jgi:antitoxin PrlF
MPLVSKLTGNGRTTIPRPVRERLGLRPGDRLLYEVEGEAVRIRKAPAVDPGCLRAIQATLSEWDSAEDDAAYADL